MTATATLRLGCPLGCPLGGPHEPPCPAADTPTPRRDTTDSRLDCDRCLTFDFDERERLETCWRSRRCKLAGKLVGGGRR